MSLFLVLECIQEYSHRIFWWLCPFMKQWLFYIRWGIITGRIVSIYGLIFSFLIPGPLRLFISLQSFYLDKLTLNFLSYCLLKPGLWGWDRFRWIRVLWNRPGWRQIFWFPIRWCIDLAWFLQLLLRFCSWFIWYIWAGLS